MFTKKKIYEISVHSTNNDYKLIDVRESVITKMVCLAQYHRHRVYNMISKFFFKFNLIYVQNLAAFRDVVCKCICFHIYIEN